MGLSCKLALLAILSTHLPSSVYGAMSMNSDILAMMSGCGHNVNLVSSVEYAKINVEMHHGMAINFTGNAEYDFLAGMIPHHTAAVDMCKVYKEHAEASGFFNPGIDSLCYNITFGAESWGIWQYDFSQPGETEQMLDILEDIGMIDHYNEGCSGNMHGGMDEGMHGDTNGGMRRDLVEGMDEDMNEDVHEDVNEDMYGNMNGDMHGDMNGDMYGDMNGDMYGDMNGDMYGNMNGDMHGVWNGDMHGNINGDMNGDIYGDIYGSMYGNIKGNMYGNMYGRIREGMNESMPGDMNEDMHGDMNEHMQGSMNGNVQGGMNEDMHRGMNGDTNGDMIGDLNSQHHDMFMGCGKLNLDQTKDYIQTNMDMHMRMSFHWTGNPGVDFLLGMIPHHQGGEYVILILS